MRTVKELLQLMLDNENLFCNGLCSWVNQLEFKTYINDQELTLLSQYIYDNKPFTLHDIFSNDCYYWKKGDIKPRIKWIKHHISIN